jgi:hypothetical protein
LQISLKVVRNPERERGTLPHTGGIVRERMRLTNISLDGADYANV